eukprot:366000-Chlamydomonas_euryale.AAC.3
MLGARYSRSDGGEANEYAVAARQEAAGWGGPSNDWDTNMRETNRVTIVPAPQSDAGAVPFGLPEGLETVDGQNAQEVAQHARGALGSTLRSSTQSDYRLALHVSHGVYAYMRQGEILEPDETISSADEFASKTSRLLHYLLKGHVEIAIGKYKESEVCTVPKYPRSLSEAFIKKLHAACSAEYATKRRVGESSVQELRNHELYKDVYSLLWGTLTHKGERTVDALKATVPDVEVFEEMFRHTLTELCSMNPGTHAYLKVSQELARMMMLLCAASRSEDTRELFLMDTVPPITLSGGVGPHPRRVWLWSRLQDKASKTSARTYMHIFEHLHAELCPIVALATYYMIRYSVEQFPDITDWEVYRKTKLFVSESYDVQFRQLKARMEALGIESDKALHAFRVVAAQLCELTRVGAKERDEHVSWLTSVATTNYVKADIPEADLEKSWFAHRFAIAIDNDVAIRECGPAIFPFLEELETRSFSPQATQSGKGLVKWFKGAIPVAIRAALDFSLPDSKFNRHPLVCRLANVQYFKELQMHYRQELDSGQYEEQRSLTNSEMHNQLMTAIATIKRRVKYLAPGYSSPAAVRPAVRPAAARLQPSIQAASNAAAMKTTSPATLAAPMAPVQAHRYHDFYKGDDMHVLYTEYDRGLYGQPSLREVSRQKRWKAPNARTHWCNQLKIVRFIEAYAEAVCASPYDVAGRLSTICGEQHGHNFYDC